MNRIALRRYTQLLVTNPGERSQVAALKFVLAHHCLLRFVDRRKVRFRHIDFAAYFEDFWHIAFKLLRNVRDIGDIGGDVLPHTAITARRGLFERPMFIAQRQRKPVNLVLRRQRDLCVCGQVQEPPHPPNKVMHILRRKCVVEAHHAFGVGDFFEARTLDRRPHLRVRTIGADQVRECGF